MTCQPTGKLGFTNLFREKNWRELWTRDEYQKAGKEYEYDKDEGKWEEGWSPIPYTRKRSNGEKRYGPKPARSDAKSQEPL
ncbi:hypothetical protein V1478_005966 [Vespula squamosa]|uniref:Calreticulin n=1 Tax=Vespula squamosa TaxID=30214 RepID=A0ABD2B8V3_VESSQ